MAEMNDIVKLAVDGYRGNVEKYSVEKSQEVLRAALIEANNGKTSLNYKDIRDGKCQGLFTIIEEVLDVLLDDALTQNDYFNTFVDYRNVARGDQNDFVVEDNNLFVVAEAADGTQGIRRQRLGGRTSTPIETRLKIVRIYEEMDRVLAGRVDFNEMVNRVARSFQQQILNDTYTLWNGATAAQLGGAAYFPVAGTYNEATLLTTVEHVEAAAGGKPAVIVGTKAALRKIAPSVQGADSQSDIYNLGYYGKFYGSPVLAVPQRHIPGTTNFVFNDKTLTIVAGDDKPIKCVREGDPIVYMRDPFANADLTNEFLYGERYGMGLVLAGGNAGIGIYKFTD